MDKVIKIGIPFRHTATSWQVALDENFEVIVDESLEDKVNLTYWKTPLPKIDGSGFYSDEKLYARFKVIYGNSESDWYTIYMDQREYGQTNQYEDPNLTYR